ncbi:GMC family oxidoreductase N-terminal domain-containing protein [Arthrobacter sp. SD76]|uniref:GMC family oxidoreductase N-terminal domain-containing protein n=1 Tax=Arthrobacter sp. SD76 TaxID=3415007 RepID=UPI003C71883B
MLTGHTVRRILHSSGRAIGVQCFDVDDVPVTVLADTVVIAAGALGTPSCCTSPA